MPPSASDEKPVQISIKWSEKDDCYVARARIYDDIYLEYGETVRDTMDRAYEAVVQALDFAEEVSPGADATEGL